MTRLAALAIVTLTGCGHLTFDLKGHEQDHCREHHIPPHQWVYHYTDDAPAICRVKTGLIFVEGCAVPSGGECHIWLPAGYKPE